MSPVLLTILDRAGETLGAGLPRVGAALVLGILGVLLARLIGRLLTRGLSAAGADGWGERAGIHDSLERLGAPRSLSKTAGRAARIALTVVAVLAALSLLGLGFLRESINEVVLFLPRLLVGLALVVAGAVIGTLARERADRLAAQLDIPGPVGRGVEVLIFAIFGLTALAQIGVSTSILTALGGILVAGAVLSAALAFGLGGREVARAVSSGRAVRGAFEVGQRIAVAGVRGEIVALDSAAAVVRTDAGTRVRIPHHMLLEEIVEVEGGAPG